MLRKFLYISLLLILTLLAAVIGAGLAYPHHLSPRHNFNTFKQISADGWIQDGSTITLPNLTKRANRLVINFNSWHPNDNYPHYQVMVCDKLAGDFIAPVNSSFTISLNGECEPRVVTFKVLNPYTTENDSRLLGSQLKSVAVTSRLGVAVTFPAIIYVWLALITVSLYLLTLGSSKKVLIAALLLPFISIAILDYVTISRPDKLLACYFFVLAVITGLKYSDLKQSKLYLNESFLVCIAVLAGALIRFYGLNFGLPQHYHPDEVPKFNAITNMIAYGSLNPLYFKHPSLLLYSAYFISRVFYYLGVVSLEQANSSSVIILSGRIVSAIAGTLSILFTYKIGREIFTAKAAVIASFVLAFLPLHVTCSRYMKEDALLTCMLLITTYLVLKATAKDKKSTLYLAGFFAGLSASSKYSGVLAFVIVASAPWLRTKSFKPAFNYIIPTLIALCIIPVGFICATPYSILDTKTFMVDFNMEKKHMIRGHDVIITPWSHLLLYHINKSIIPGMTVPAAFLGIAGIVALLKRFKIMGLFLVGLFLLFYLPAEFVNAKPAPQPERYIVPCLPFLALSAAILLDGIKSRYLRLALTAILLLSPAVRSINLARDITYDTRARMADWMRNNLPKGSSVAFFWRPYVPTFPNGEFEMVELHREAFIAGINIPRLKNVQADYLLLSSLTYGRHFDQIEASPRNRQLIRKVFDQIPIIHEEVAESGRYGFNNPKVTLFSLKDWKK